MSPPRFITPLLLCAALMLCPAIAQAAQTRAELAAARTLLEQRLAAVPGRVEIELRAPQATLPECLEPEAFIPGNPNLIGQLTVGVRCVSPSGATTTRYLRAMLRRFAPYWVADRDIDAGALLSLSDLERREGDLSQLPGRLVTDPAQLIGQQTVRRINRGTALLEGMTRAPSVIQRNDRVEVRAEGNGFTILTEGVALEDAALEQRLRVRLASGSVVGVTASGANSATLSR
ncbi:flagellar basal body P-ring formation chaperone FlgA [Halotalea alkalilenta]|uniref:Flagella basal body P-ring formation protein FlgA n=1 Tax=Halotalea alkalilenta TaxID=376489 RepID=A0A172YGP5_9GAMM|nr:flagellar basal body P-ring formation chaperone FlgA [Halotalea alkalilenta]ANF58377.1 hypothetical protein A5892_13595 [Halotalea alkalilenta]